MNGVRFRVCVSQAASQSAIWLISCALLTNIKKSTLTLIKRNAESCFEINERHAKEPLTVARSFVGSFVLSQRFQTRRRQINEAISTVAVNKRND